MYVSQNGCHSEDWCLATAIVVINVIYNFEKNGLSKVIYAEKVIYLFFKNKLIFWNYFFKKPNQLSVPCYKTNMERKEDTIKWSTDTAMEETDSESHSEDVIARNWQTIVQTADNVDCGLSQFLQCTSVWITIFIKSATCSSFHILTKTSLWLV